MNHLFKALSLFVVGFAFNTPAVAQEFLETVSALMRHGLIHIRVDGKLPDGTTAKPLEASAFFMSEDGHVVTAKHVVLGTTNWSTFRDKLGDDTAFRYVQTNFVYQGRRNKDDAASEVFLMVPIAVDEASDLAVLRVTTWTPTLRRKQWPLPKIEHLAASSKGLHVFGLGFPQTKKDAYQYGHDQVPGVVQTHGVIHEGMQITETNLPFEPGSSGGPVFTRQGRIAGVIYGGKALSSTTYFTPGNSLSAFLGRLGILY